MKHEGYIRYGKLNLWERKLFKQGIIYGALIILFLIGFVSVARAEWFAGEGRACTPRTQCKENLYCDDSGTNTGIGICKPYPNDEGLVYGGGGGGLVLIDCSIPENYDDCVKVGIIQDQVIEVINIEPTSPPSFSKLFIIIIVLIWLWRLRSSLKT